MGDEQHGQSLGASHVDRQVDDASPPWTLRVEAAHIHQPDGWLSPGYLEISDDGRIHAVHAVAPADWRADERIEGAVVPGLGNVHSHAFHRALAGRTESREPGDRDDLWTWRRRMYEVAARVGPAEQRAIAAQLDVELLRGGITQVGEFHYLHRDPQGRRYADPGEMAWALAEAAAAVGIGLTLLPVLYRQGGFGEPLRPEQVRFSLDVDEVVRIATAARDEGGPLLTGGVAPHSLRATTLDQVRDLVDAWRSTGGGPIHVHVAERIEEVVDGRAHLGMTPLRALLDGPGLDGDWCLVHATHIQSDEVSDVAGSGAVVGLCPMTEATLADGVFPLRSLIDLSGTWGIGTDGHHTTDMATELRCLELGQRLSTGRRNVVAGSSGVRRHTGRALFDGALAGSRALDAGMGPLGPGRRADLVVLDTDSDSLIGHRLETILDGWILSGGRSPVRHVMVAGRWRIRDGHHPDEDGIRDRFRAALSRLGLA